MKKLLVVIDMQNDFIDGALGSREAVDILPLVVDKVRNFAGRVLFTRDTHFNNYLDTQEGRNLPVKHCIKDSPGWQIHAQLQPYVQEEPINKLSFGSSELAIRLAEENLRQPIDCITLIGLCTDICVIANAMTIKSFLPEVRIQVDARCCAGVTPVSHQQALQAMKACQIEIIHE